MAAIIYNKHNFEGIRFKILQETGKLFLQKCTKKKVTKTVAEVGSSIFSQEIQFEDDQKKGKNLSTLRKKITRAISQLERGEETPDKARFQFLQDIFFQSMLVLIEKNVDKREFFFQGESTLLTQLLAIEDPVYRAKLMHTLSYAAVEANLQDMALHYAKSALALSPNDSEIQYYANALITITTADSGASS